MNTRNRDFDKRPKRACGTCNGKKRIMKPLWKTGVDGKPMYETVECPDCDGTGEEK